MQFSFVIASVVALAAMAIAGPGAPENTEASYIVSDAELDHWLSTTDAKLTFIGEEGNNPLAARAGKTRVVYCSSRKGPVCGGACSVYNGGNTCLRAPKTACISATRNVAFCDKGGCSGSCNYINSCGKRLDGGFCATPGTKSILVPF
ncbi:hypothetical protein AB1N83_013473 [Pleurotus pulmonarius]|nr:hypothetical protein EYR38_008985 [Pleurotus pulmonarius]